MLRYYMTPETQRALIAESNRQIANRALNSYRRQLRASGVDEPSAAAALASNEDEWTEDAVSDSAFARLVSDLQSTPVRVADHA